MSKNENPKKVLGKKRSFSLSSLFEIYYNSEKGIFLNLNA